MCVQHLSSLKFMKKRKKPGVCASGLQLCLTLCNPMDCCRQAPLSLGSSWQEHWSGLPGPPPGELPHPGTEPESPAAPALQTDSLPWATGEAQKSGISMKSLKNKVGRLNLAHFCIYYKAMVTKAVWYQYRKKNVSQGNRLEIQETYLWIW